MMLKLTAVQLALAGVVALAAGPVAAFDAPAVRAAADRSLDADYAHLEALYKDIHQHPELGFQEVRTAALLAGEMRALGFTVTEHVNKTGLVAIYKNGEGPLVLVRTELDALPMEEKTGLAYASRAKQIWNGAETFVDHSCGHDIHMAAWVGAATSLLSMKDQWRGTLMFIAQPAEEVADGAKGMIREGLFTRFGKPDYGFALHDDPEASGMISYLAGPVSSNDNELDITFKGRGGHGSMPDATIDPILIASRFVVDVQSVISREKGPAAFGVVTVGAIEGGTAGNIIPDHATVRGTIRSFDPIVRAKLVEGVARVAKAEAAMAGAPEPDINLTAYGDAVVNDPALTERTARAFKAAFGDQARPMDAPIAASEDFSEYVKAGVPSVFFFVGATDPKVVAAAKAGGPPVPVNHSPLFAPVPQTTLRAAVEAMTVAVMDVMAR